MSSFFGELRKRKVVRAMIAYLITGWIVVQIASVVLPAFEVPRWVLAAIVIVLALGVPVVLVLGWMFDLAPSGLEKTPESSVTASRYKPALFVTAIALTAFFLVSIFAVQRWRGGGESSFTSGEKSIAVLPFESLSEDKENAYFANGIQEEILTRLTKIGALKVISRGSTRQYESQPTNLPEIAKQLGVTHVLEGTVQRAGEQVRVNVQLLDARSDAHVWAESFDRKLTDLFTVESDIAEKVASTLQAQLTGEEQQALAVTPTRNAAAYDAYLRGLAYERITAVAPETFESAIHFYEEAVKADPSFALVWAHLADVHSSMYHFGFDHTPARLESMKRAAETAMRLQPKLGEALLAWGFYQYRGTQDYHAADKAFDEARQRLPNDAWTIECGSFVKRRQGKWEETIALLDKVMELDPRNANLHSELGYTLLFTRNFKRAREVAEHGLTISPDDSTLTALRATVCQAEGDLDGADQALASQPLQPSNPTVFTTQMTQLLFRRRYEQLISTLSAALQFPDTSLGGQLGEYYVILSLAQQASGDEPAARKTCEQGIAYLDQIRAKNADTWFVSACFGLLRAGLGDQAGAMREGEHALALTGPDVSARPDVDEAITRMNARLGRTDAAMNVLPRLLHESYQKSFFGAVLTPTLLRLDPAFDSLRKDARFRELSATP